MTAPSANDEMPTRLETTLSFPYLQGNTATQHDPGATPGSRAKGLGMTSTSPAPPTVHPGLVLAALALGGFAIGTTEFASMSLLPYFARDLGIDAPTAGHAISAYARSEERRVGKECRRLCRSRWSPYH
jgi:hypothetical protein